jgi:phosphatidylinositol-3-phosphatase
MLMKIKRNLLFIAVVAATRIASAIPAQGGVGDVFVISMENHNFTQPGSYTSTQAIFGNANAPFINSLITVGNANAAQTSWASKYYNVAAGIHPSEPNYIWSEAGTNFGVLNDNDPFANAGANEQNTTQHLSGRLQAAGIGWKSYQEDIDLNTSNGQVLAQNQWTVPLSSFSGSFGSGATANPYNGSLQYNYAAKHNPQIFLTDTSGGNNSTTSNPQVSHYAPLQQLQTDLTNNTVARFNWITPNQYNDMHTALSGGFTYHSTHLTGDSAQVAQGDNFLSVIVPTIMASQAYQNNGLIMIWFDETEGGDTTSYTLPYIVISPLAKGNAYQSTINFTHSSDLRTLQEILQVAGQSPTGYLGDAANVSDEADLFQPGVIPSTVPEPSSLILALVGLGLLVRYHVRK